MNRVDLGNPPSGEKTWEFIREEAIRPEDDNDRPLPLAAHWGTGIGPDGYNPSYQMDEIEYRGSLLLPWFQMPEESHKIDDPRWIEYYEPAIRRAAAMRLPITFVGSQWEYPFTHDARYAAMPKAENPNVVLANGTVETRLSPFGGVGTWRALGKQVTSTAFLKRLQELYPDPPLVEFVSNNEHIGCCALPSSEVERDVRFGELYGNGDGSPYFKVKVAQDGYAKLYRALQSGMRDGLVSSTWKERTLFVGYDAFGPSSYGRYNDWPLAGAGLARPGKISPAADMWDVGSPSFYMHNWDGSLDNKVYSPQIEAMNWVFMLKEARRSNPQFRFEISTWDGNEPTNGTGDEVDDHGNGGFGTDKRKLFTKYDAPYSPARYGGMVQYGMWLLRPRVVREFRSYLDTRTGSEPYFRAMIDAVGRVHRNSTLREFWRLGKLVPNTAHLHPYQMALFPEYESEQRWFGLDTSVATITEQSSLTAYVSVYALALVLGDAPNRRWLVYGHAPGGSFRQVKVKIPEFHEVTLPEISIEGSFFVVEESTGAVIPLGLPASEAPGEVTSFQTNFRDIISGSRQLSPGNTITAMGTNLAGADRISFDVVTAFGAYGTHQTIDCTASGSTTDSACKLLFAGENQLNFVLPSLSAALDSVGPLPATMGLTLRAWRGSLLVGSGWIPLYSAAPGIQTVEGFGAGVVFGTVIHHDQTSPDISEATYQDIAGAFGPRLISKKKASLLLDIPLYGYRNPAAYRIQRDGAGVFNYCAPGAGSKHIYFDGKEVPVLDIRNAPDHVDVRVDATAIIDQIGTGQKLVSIAANIVDCFGIDRPSNNATVLFGTAAP